jgi:hypothetical protein
MKSVDYVTAMFVCLALLSIMVGGAEVFAAENIGAVVALRGNARIERETKVIDAKVKDGIQLKDIVETKENSKAKMLFIDDSVLTLGEKSKAVIKEFVYSKDKIDRRSIFNLIDGKMRSVVGRTELEIQTPTLIAAARGTVFDIETGMISGKPFTTCTSYEGLVDIRSIDPAITGRVTLRPGMTVTVISGQPLPAPTPAPTTTTLQHSGAASATPAPSLPLIQAPPIQQQPQLPPAPLPTTPNTGGIRVGW